MKTAKELEAELDNAEEHLRLIVLEMSNGTNDISDSEGTSYKEVLEIVKAHNKELQAQVVQLREATQGLIKCLELLDQHNKIEKPQPSVCIRAIRDGVLALSTSPPQVIPKYVADNLAEPIRQIFNDDFGYKELEEYTGRLEGYFLRHESKIERDLKSALTAYEQHTK